MIRYKCSISTNMDHIMFAIRSSPSTISILSTMVRPEGVRCFGASVNTLWNIILHKGRYIQYLRHDTVQVIYLDEYGSHYVRNTIGPFHHIYIIDMISAITGSDPPPIPMEISTAMQSLQDTKNSQFWSVLLQEHILLCNPSRRFEDEFPFLKG